MRSSHESVSFARPLRSLGAIMATAVLLGAGSPLFRPAPLSAQEMMEEEAATYRLTVSNTAGALQPLTPSLVVLHDRGLRIFEEGSAASPELERIAESGNHGPLTARLEDDDRVHAIQVAFGTVEGERGPILPGASASVEIQGPPGSRLTLVSMLVCTNDGFVGLGSVRLPDEVGDTLSHRASAYDAGTERNTEARGDLVPPCVMATTGSEGGTGEDQPSVAEDAVVRSHPGIDDDMDDMGMGGDDILGARHRWSAPVAVIEIERIG